MSGFTSPILGREKKRGIRRSSHSQLSRLAFLRSLRCYAALFANIMQAFTNSFPLRQVAHGAFEGAPGSVYTLHTSTQGSGGFEASNAPSSRARLRAGN